MTRHQGEATDTGMIAIAMQHKDRKRRKAVTIELVSDILRRTQAVDMATFRSKRMCAQRQDLNSTAASGLLASTACGCIVFS